MPAVSTSRSETSQLSLGVLQTVRLLIYPIVFCSRPDAANEAISGRNVRWLSPIMLQSVVNLAFTVLEIFA